MTSTTHTSGVPYHAEGEKLVWVLDKGLFGKISITADPEESSVSISGDIELTIDELHAISAAWYRAGVHARRGDPDE